MATLDDTKKQEMTSVPLSHRLRAETKEAHTAAERSGIMRELLRGTISRHTYVVLLKNLAAIYETLESQIASNGDHMALRGVDWSVVARKTPLDNDIRALSGVNEPDGADNKSNEISSALVQATLEYAAHLDALGRSAPEFLFPHAYLRYLGDMYGGQIIKKIVLEKVLKNEPPAVSFYEFSDIPDLHTYMVSFRESLDSIALSDADADRMVAEAMLGYAFHSKIFEQLAAHN